MRALYEVPPARRQTWRRSDFRCAALRPFMVRQAGCNQLRKVFQPTPLKREIRFPETGCWRARIRPKPDRAMQAVPLGRLPPGKSGTPPCKSGQLEKDLGLEVSSARQGGRIILFEFMRSFSLVQVLLSLTFWICDTLGRTHGTFRTL